MLQNILYSIVLLYVILAMVAYIDSKQPILVFGHYLPRSSSISARLVVGPIIMLGIGVAFAFMGVVLLLPFFLFGIGFKGLAAISLIIFGYLGRTNSLVNINGLLIKFDFPFDIPVGLLSFWILGLRYLIIGSILLIPLLPFFL